MFRRIDDAIIIRSARSLLNIVSTPQFEEIVIKPLDGINHTIPLILRKHVGVIVDITLPGLTIGPVGRFGMTGNNRPSVLIEQTHTSQPFGITPSIRSFGRFALTFANAASHEYPLAIKVVVTPTIAPLA
jgi:hypothetical protein